MANGKLTPRKLQILKAVVDAHIANGDPVGSKYLSQETSLTCSSATIRNEMAELEEMGYLVQPHTSAGRVPSALGYGLYVDALIQQYNSTRSELDDINERLRYKLSEMDRILEEASRLAASFTDYTGIAFKSGVSGARVTAYNTVPLSEREFLLIMQFAKDGVKTKTVRSPIQISQEMTERLSELLNTYLVNLTDNEITVPQVMRIEGLMGHPGSALVHPTIKMIYEAMNELDTREVKLDGITKLLQYPEYSDVSKLRGLMGVLEEKDKLMDVISTHTSERGGIHVYIGNEDDGDALSGTTMIFKNVNVGGSQLSVGVIGPKRMNYGKVIDMINKLATGIDRMFGDGALLPPADDE